MADATQLSKNVHHIEKALTQKGLPFNVVSFSESTRTAQEAATAIGCTIGQIIKSLIFRTENHVPILILVSGANRVNEAKIAGQLGEKFGKADADFTRQVTGFAIGGVPPIGHMQPIKTFIDQDLLQFNELWAAAGSPYTVFSLPAAALQALTNGTIISVK